MRKGTFPQNFHTRKLGEFFGILCSASYREFVVVHREKVTYLLESCAKHSLLEQLFLWRTQHRRNKKFQMHSPLSSGHYWNDSLRLAGISLRCTRHTASLFGFSVEMHRQQQWHLITFNQVEHILRSRYQLYFLIKLVTKANYKTLHHPIFYPCYQLRCH